MIDPLKERLYQLLPAIYRQRDQDQNYALRALMNAFESEFQLLETDMDNLYDNWFIETAAEWVVPYIGELLGVDNLSDKKNLFFSQRRRVANTIGYRRRKGISASLEHVAQDVTGWPARLIEYKQLLAITQHMAHIQPERGTTINMRQHNVLAQLTGPFDSTAHSIDVRRIGTNTDLQAPVAPYDIIQGKYHPHNLGLVLWRLQSYQMANVPASMVTREHGNKQATNCFTFDPLNRDMQLFTFPQEILTTTGRTDPGNVPSPISHAAFANDLAAYNARQQEEQGTNSLYYGPDGSLCIILNGRPLTPAEIISADLSQWQPPVADGKLIAVDVVLGRIIILASKAVTESPQYTLETNYCYGFSTEIGGGPYSRDLPPVETFIIDVLRGSNTATLKQAFTAWDEYCQTTNKPRGTIRILDNRMFVERNLSITLPTNSRLTIEATHGLRPIISSPGSLDIRSTGQNTHLHLNGLLIHCPLRLQGDLQLDIAHCTIAPHGIEIQRSTPNTSTFQLTIDHCIVGPVRLARGRGNLQIQNSIIDASGAPYAITTLGTAHHATFVAQIERTTIFGAVQLQALTLAREVIFTAPCTVQQQQTGQVSFCYLPKGSQTPRRDRCQPELSMQQSQQTSSDEQLSPLFTSTHYGDPGYAQLSTLCPRQIRRGAEDGSEMGAFHDLHTIQRQDNLYRILDEYAPFEFATSIFYAT